LVENFGNVTSDPTTFHHSGFRLYQQTALGFSVDDCYLLFHVDCVFILLYEYIVASPTSPLCLISCLARPMASLRISSIRDIFGFYVRKNVADLLDSSGVSAFFNCKKPNSVN
jgi:hypothetical protein